MAATYRSFALALGLAFGFSSAIAAPILVTPGKAAGYMYFPPGLASSATSPTDVSVLQTCIVSPKPLSTLVLSTRDWGTFAGPLKVFYSIIGGAGGADVFGGGGGSSAILKNGSVVDVAEGGNASPGTGSIVRPSIKSGNFSAAKSDTLDFFTGGGGGRGSLYYGDYYYNNTISTGGGGAGYTGGGGAVQSATIYYGMTGEIRAAWKAARGGQRASGGTGGTFTVPSGSNPYLYYSPGTSGSTNGTGGPAGGSAYGTSATRAQNGAGCAYPNSDGCAADFGPAVFAGAAGNAAPFSRNVNPAQTNTASYPISVADCKGSGKVVYSGQTFIQNPPCNSIDYSVASVAALFGVAANAAAKAGDAGQIVLQYQAPVCNLIPNFDQQ